jgi:hypothetical protein
MSIGDIAGSFAIIGATVALLIIVWKGFKPL